MPAQFLSEETCCKCGVVFGLTLEHKRQRKHDRDFFYCPNGHSQQYTTASASNMRERVEVLERELAEMTKSRDHCRNWSDRLQARVARLKKLVPPKPKPKRKRKRKRRTKAKQS